MDVALNRKRSKLAIDDDNDEKEEEWRRPAPSPALPTFSDSSKRSRAKDELEELDLIRPEEAWGVDVQSILSSNTLATPLGSRLEAHNNARNYQKDDSIIILCVQGNIKLHYDLLCSALPELYGIAPSLQALVLCRHPAMHLPSPTATISLPLIQAVGPSYNHFVRLGLLHPLGGGEHPLDALVVIDSWARRRLVLPFGWGAGKHADTPAGRIVQTRLMDLLRNCVRTLVDE